ncbi:MAG: SMC-Scp complex subunit ScpB [Spirochaetaceae bacterium]|jgi:segregation and condensation protein B|nr:SMC-Scp complex subunit ScpB [Spirochaetaceae bacterium]
MSLEKEVALLESVMFLEAEPIKISYISRICQWEKGQSRQVLQALKEKLKSPAEGLDLFEIEKGYYLAPKEELWDYLKDHYGKKNDEKLSRAAMETLSIIAYSQPLTRGEVENIRGVSVEGMIRLLLKKDLIKEVGKKDLPGKPILYGTTREFLKLFALNSISDLPKLDEVEKDRFELNG